MSSLSIALAAATFASQAQAADRVASGTLQVSATVMTSCRVAADQPTDSNRCAPAQARRIQTSAALSAEATTQAAAAPATVSTGATVRGDVTYQIDF